MTFMNKMERKFGKFAIRNLTIYIVGGYVIGYLLGMFYQDLLNKLVLWPAAVMKGEVWRLFTWVITPPDMNISIFTIIMLIFYLSIGNLLERTLGTFLYNVYIFSSLLFTMVGYMLVYILCVYVFQYIPDLSVIGSFASTYYICMSLFLAVAACYPDMSVYYAMIIPIKMKWLSIIYAVLVVYYFVNESFMGRVNIVMSLLSFAIFFLSTRNIRKFSPKQIKRKRNYAKQVKVNKAENITHKCCVCGITDKEAPNLQFRYCSKCKGNREYCQDHLFTHTHVQ